MHFNQADKDKSGMIDFNEFCVLYEELCVEAHLPIAMGARAPRK